MPTIVGYAGPLTYAVISYVIIWLSIILFSRGVSMGQNVWLVHKGFSLSMVIGIVIMPTVGIISILIVATIFYIIYRVLGGVESYEGTVRFTFYATAVMIFSWIPFIGL